MANSLVVPSGRSLAKREIAAMMFDKDEGLFVFATTHFDEMLQEFRRRYYAMDFPL